MKLDEKALKAAFYVFMDAKAKEAAIDRLRLVIEAYLAALPADDALWRNIANILDHEAKYYNAEVGDRLSNIYDLTDMIIAQIIRQHQSGEGKDI